MISAFISRYRIWRLGCVVDGYQWRPKLPSGWKWGTGEVDECVFAETWPGPRSIGVYVSAYEAKNGALIADIRIDCAWSDERRLAIAGAIHGIDAFCERASEREGVIVERGPRKASLKERMRLWLRKKRAKFKRWVLTNL